MPLCKKCRAYIAERTRQRLRDTAALGGRPRIEIPERLLIAALEGRATYETIAKRVGCSVMTVRRRVQQLESKT